MRAVGRACFLSGFSGLVSRRLPGTKAGRQVINISSDSGGLFSDDDGD